MLCEVNETDEMRVGKFLAGLKEEIRKKLILTPNLTLPMACNLALSLEKFVTKKRSTSNYNYTRTPKNLPPRTPTNSVSAPKRDNQDRGVKNKATLPLKNVVCFKCHGHRYYNNDCPNAKAFTIQEWTEIQEDTKPKVMLVSKNGKEEECWPSVSDEEPEGSYIVNEAGSLQRYESSMEESESEEEREKVLPEDDHYNLVVRRNFHTTPQVKSSDQRENIFQTKCRVKDKICDLIIDGGSESNYVSMDLVTKLNLKTKAHPHPYKLNWLGSKASGSVTKQCFIGFNIGTYKDKVMCDVLDMSACHILLGRSWQYDRKTTHDGFSNIYTIKLEGKMKELIPLPPPTRKAIHLISRKSCEKEVRNRTTVYLLFTKEVCRTLDAPFEVRQLLEQYKGVFADDLPRGLPPIRGIEHQINDTRGCFA